ncbi:hypothetical protein M5K25_004531 [Dendrobium thyrsiflorum]|uniref:DUF4283 domain-containing protein n=1 Tax=Dendrobium thyrsiflorum TaxID=117978 RepID=A0ABD0VUE3_DENTH
MAGPSSSNPWFLHKDSTSGSFKEVLEGPIASAKIDFVHSSVKGIPALLFDDAVVSKLAAPFSFTLVGKFMLRRPNIDTIRKFFFNLKLSGAFSVGLMDQRHIAIQLSNDLDYSHIFSRRVYYILGCQMRLLKWTPDFDVREESPIALVWISFPNLRLHFYNNQVLFALASIFGRPLQTDQATSVISRPSVARVLVELDVSKKHPKEVWLGSEINGKPKEHVPVEGPKIGTETNVCEGEPSMLQCPIQVEEGDSVSRDGGDGYVNTHACNNVNEDGNKENVDEQMIAVLKREDFSINSVFLENKFDKILCEDFLPNNSNAQAMNAEELVEDGEFVVSPIPVNVSSNANSKEQDFSGKHKSICRQNIGELANSVEESDNNKFKLVSNMQVPPLSINKKNALAFPCPKVLCHVSSFAVVSLFRFSFSLGSGCSLSWMCWLVVTGFPIIFLVGGDAVFLCFAGSRTSGLKWWSAERRASDGGPAERRASGGCSEERRALDGGLAERQASGGGLVERRASSNGLAECRASGGGPAERRASGGGPAERRALGGSPEEHRALGGGPEECRALGGGPAELWRQVVVWRWFGRTLGLRWWSGGTPASGGGPTVVRQNSGDPVPLDGLIELWSHLEVLVLVGNLTEFRRQVVVRRRYDVRRWFDRTSCVRWWSGRMSGISWWSSRTSGVKWLSGRTSGLKQNVGCQVVVRQNIGPQMVVRQNIGPQIKGKLGVV